METSIIPLAPLSAAALMLGASAAHAQSGGFDLSWFTIDGGASAASTGANYTLVGTSGQPDAYAVLGGFWTALAGPSTTPCYPNCDGSTQTPVLNVADFTCFLQKFAASDPYANCDNSTTPPVLNVADFTCFLTKFAAGCN
jgi:hypothetical protein